MNKNINEFNKALIYSNKNLEKMARKIVNESYNAALMEMFTDKCILADHTTGQIFEAKYSFDGNTFIFEEFEEIKLKKDDFSIREAIGDFFDDKSVNLEEAYERYASNTPDVFENSLTEALASKNMEEVINYGELEGINEELDELKETELFKEFSERINERPLDNVKVFDWVNPVKVSLIDEDCNKVVNKSLKKKAKKLKANNNFKKELKDSAEMALEGEMSPLETLVYENIEIIGLDKSEIKELVGLSVIGSKSLMENRNKITNMIDNIIAEDSELAFKRDLLAEAEEADDASDAPDTKEEDISKVKDALEKAKEAASDEKLISKIESLIDSLDSAEADGETDVGAVKESISLLSL